MVDVDVLAIQHVQHLASQIGSRPLGSKKNIVAAEYVHAVFEAAGLTVTKQEFPCPIWEERGTRLELDGQRYVAAANIFSPSCHIVATYVPLGSMAELEKAELTGKIALLYGDLTSGYGYSARRGYYFPERDQQVYRILEEKRPVAVVTVQPQVGSLQRLISDWEFGLPSATVPAEVGLILRRNGSNRLQIKIDSHASPSNFCNIVGTKKGLRQEKIILCAHMDTMPDAPGALDNGSGVSVLLTLAEFLCKRELPLALELIALNGHENGGVGVAEYLRQRKHELGQVAAVINVDGVGQYVGTNTVAVFSSSPALQEQVELHRQACIGLVQVAPWYESDHTAFFTRGIPTLALSSIGVTNTMHSPGDTLEWISPAKLGQIISFITDIVTCLQDKPLEWSREK